MQRSNIQRIPDEIHMQRAPQALLPTRVNIAVKQALGIPVYAIVRVPVPGGRFHYTDQRVA